MTEKAGYLFLKLLIADCWSRFSTVRDHL